MKRFVFYLIFFAAFAAQSQTLGPLLHELKHAKEDTNKVLLMNKIGFEYEIKSSFDSAVYYYKAGKTISEKLNYPVGILKYISNYTSILNYQEKNEEGLELNLQAIELAKKINNQYQLACAYSNTGASYYNLYMYDKTIEYFLKAADFFEKENKKKNLALLYGNLAGAYSEIEEQDAKGYSYGLKALALNREINDTLGIEESLANTSGILMDKLRYDSVRVLVKQLYEIGKIAKHKRAQMTALTHMNFLCMKEKNYSAIKNYAAELVQVATEIDDKEGIAAGLQYTGKYFFEIKQYPEAKNYLLKAIAILKEYKILKSLGLSYITLHDIELAMGNHEAFHRYGRLSDSIEQVLIDRRIDRNIRESETKYSVQKKEAQIEALDKENKIKQLTLQQKNQTTALLIIAIIIVLLIGLLYYRYSKQKSKLLFSEAEIQRQRITELENEKKLIITQSVIQGQEEERKRLAKDLHDGLGGILSSAKFSFNNMKNNLIISPENAIAFENSLSMLDMSIRELRRVAHNMMPEALVKFGLDTALKDFCDSINQANTVQFTYQSFDLKDEDVSKNKISTVYRVIQELVNNILKHANAKTALVQLVKTENTLSITVEDDGKGFDTSLLNSSSGIGHQNLKSRVAYLNGTIDIQSAPGKGTSVIIEIPNISHD